MRLPMPTRLIRPAKALATLLTLKRLIARVRPHMLCQIAALSKRFATPRKTAHKRLAARMRPLVDRQGSRNTERFATARIVADIGPFERVRPHVLGKGVLLAEAFTAFVAFEGPVAGVRLNVPEHFLLL